MADKDTSALPAEAISSSSAKAFTARFSNHPKEPKRKEEKEEKEVKNPKEAKSEKIVRDESDNWCESADVGGVEDDKVPDEM